MLRLAGQGAFAGPVLDAGVETVLDCGLFHTFDGDERRDYAATLASVTAPGGNLYLLCFGDVSAARAGPHPVTESDLRAAFTRGGGWSVSSVTPELIQTRFDAHGAPAWLAKAERTSAVLRRRESEGS